MLWFTNHFSCIYFCQNWPLPRTVWNRASIWMPWTLHQGSLVWPQQTGWEILYSRWVEKSVFLSRCRYHFTEPSLLYQASVKMSDLGERAHAFSSPPPPPPLPPFRAERNANRAFSSPWENVKQASNTRQKNVIKGAGVSARRRWRGLRLGPGQIEFQEGLPITARTF